MSTFNDNLSADMTDPEFAAEFERTTDEVRRERYAAAIAAADDMRKDWCYAEADAAIAMADEEFAPIREEITNLHRDACKDAAENARLRAELEDVKRKHENFKKGSDAGGKEMRKRLSEAEDTISRVRDVLDEWYGTSDASALSAEIRTALNGESS